MYTVLSTKTDDEARMPLRPQSPTFYGHNLNFVRLHGYKLLAAFVICFIFIQYFSGIASYRHHYIQYIPPRMNIVIQRDVNGQQFAAQVSESTASSSNNITHLSKTLLKEEDLERTREIILKMITTNSTSLNSSSHNDVILNATSSHKNLTLCPVTPPKDKLVGRLKVLTDCPSFEQIEAMYPQLEPGGRFRPSECTSRHRVAIIVPFRDREEHLRVFLHNIHAMLMRQQVDYAIYIVEEIPHAKFNRAKLMNVGFKEALLQYDYQCFIFHDVDLIPEDDRNLYTCPDQPRHMSVAVDTMSYRLPYKDIFGGVSAVTKEQMRKVNGYSNEFWGWGGEDDDFSNRIRHYGFRISRYPAEIARYKMLKHKKDTPNPDRYQKLYKGRMRFKTDGLNSLKYKTVKIVYKKLYTQVLVDLLQPNT